MRIGLVFLLCISQVAAQIAISNLDFERGDPGEVPPGWFVPGSSKEAGYEASTATDGCYKGKCAVLTVGNVENNQRSGNLMNTVDAVSHRGEQVVFRAAVRAEKGAAAMWARVDRAEGRMGFFDNMQDRPIQPGEWRFYEIRGTVDHEATVLHYGVMAHGDARVWVDEASLVFSAVPEPATAVSVETRDAIREQYARVDRAYTTKNFAGLKEVAAPGARVGSAGMTMPVEEALGRIEAALAGASELSVVTSIDSLRLQGADVHVLTTSKQTMKKDGTLSAAIVSSADVWTRIDGEWRLRQSLSTGMREVREPDSPATVRSVAAEMKKQMVVLSGVEAGKPAEDLAAFGRAVGDARVVALGEATHGTREIFQMKHRLLEYLVKAKGFTVFAMEANWPECEAADRYVKTGEGDPATALEDMYFWTWQTEEVLAMLEWMRAFNQQPGDHPMLSFTSFDMQTYTVASRRVSEYVKRYSPEQVGEVESAYSVFQKLSPKTVSSPAFQDAAARAEKIVELITEKRQELVNASSVDAYRTALQAAKIVAQAARLRAPGAGPGYRDEMMAVNARWLLDEVYPGQKMVIWAHNGHVTTEKQASYRPMGSWLRESLGTQLYVLGFAIHTGTVRARTREDGRSMEVVESPLPAAPEGTGTATFSATGAQLFFLDLRSLQGELAKWTSTPHLFRSLGALWDRTNPQDFMRSETLNKAYDGLIYIETTQAARGLE